MTPLQRLQASPDFHPRTTPIDIPHIESRLGHTLPDDLRELLTTCGSFQDFFGECFFWLFSIDQLIEYNTNPDLTEQYPDHILFASDGGGELYALNTDHTPPRYALVPAIGAPEDALDQGPTLNNLLHRIEHDELFEPPPP